MIEGQVPAKEALRIVLDNVEAVGKETVPLTKGAGRILFSDLAALRTQPPFDASAMDGYALRSQDISELPCDFTVPGQSAAGHPYTKTVNQGEAIRIFTGGRVPAECDTIVIQENTIAGDGSVSVLQGEEIGRYIRKAGLDFEEGQILLKSGDVLDPQRLALAASMNHPQVCVFKQPKVAIIATGDELVEPGSQLKDGQIIASNSYGLAAIASQAGAQVLDMGIALDTTQALARKCEDALDQGADLIITMGGASVGDHDLVMPTLSEMGFAFEFSKIALKPGKPFLFAKKRHQGRMVRAIGLAGNPVSSMISGHVFAKPLIHLLAGKSVESIQPTSAIADVDIPANGERQEYMRGHYVGTQNGTIAVRPFASQDSSMLANLVRADCLIIREINAPKMPAGDMCQIIPMKEI